MFVRSIFVMSIPQSHMQEHLSKAYVRAVVARAGAKLDISESPEYGSDGIIKEVRTLSDGKYQDTGWLFHFQIKSTTTSEIKGDFVSYAMEAKAYQKLVTWQGTTFCILILFRLPKSLEKWLRLDEEQLCLSHCCYWDIITTPPTVNSSSKTIKIPRTQIFNPDAVKKLLIKVKEKRF